MPGVVPAIPRLKFTNAAGVPVASGSVTVYLAGTTTLANTFQDKALTIENNNPVPLDGNGEALFWLDPSLTYKFLLKDANNANVSGWPVDNILGGGQAPTLQQSHVDQFSANGVNKSFTLSATPGSVYDTNVYVSGVYQEKSTYSLAGPVLTFANAPALGMGNIEVTYYVLLDFTGLAATIAGYSAAASASASDAQTSALAASTSETNAAGSVTAINNRIYPGTYTVAPTTRPDGSAIQAGDEYFDSTLNKRFTYSSSTWVASDINTANLAAPSGSSLVGHDSETVASVLHSVAFRPEAHGAVAYPTRAAAEAGTDSSAALALTFADWYAHGGTIFLSGWYRATTAFLLSNSNTPTTIGTQPPLRFTGIGGHATGRGEKVNYGSGIVWTAETGTAVAKIDTRGSGILTFDNCSLASSSGSGNTKPFVHTTFTVVKTGVGFALDGAVRGASAAEDGFVLGGQSDHEGIPGFDLTSSDAGFQGYGTDITGVHCNGIRRLAVLQRYANAVRVTKNVLWGTCGNNSATGGAIEVDGAPIAPTTYAVGPYIHANLIELTNYKYGIYLKNAIHADVVGNDGYDATATTLALVYVDATCQNIRVAPSLAPAGKPYVLPTPVLSGNVRIVGGEQSFSDVLNTLKCGIAGYPNEFGPTVFRPTLADPTTFQPATGTPAMPDGSVLVNWLRATDAATNPGAAYFSLTYGGGINVLGNQAGNITNGLATGASFWTNGRSWGFNGLTGSNMLQNSGTGGSTYTAQNFSFIWKDHTGAVVGRLGKHGPAGQETIQLGTAFDVGWYRHSSTVARFTTKLTAELGLGVGNSAAATALGTLSKKMEVFDSSGASLGFVPIYTSIT